MMNPTSVQTVMADEHFVEELEAARKALELTKRQLAKIVEISPVTLTRWTTTTTRPQLSSRQWWLLTDWLIEVRKQVAHRLLDPYATSVGQIAGRGEVFQTSLAPAPLICDYLAGTFEGSWRTGGSCGADLYSGSILRDLPTVIETRDWQRVRVENTAGSGSLTEMVKRQKAEQEALDREWRELFGEDPSPALTPIVMRRRIEAARARAKEESHGHA